ncbi:Wzz/FepE/Etk N-terminal domain-containing protein [Mucilaginibacter sp. RS28]|uniref:Wzz/FepE/Etk N-terminal domain-containing protein n=1 Tax=Mucilaginibacter straminoryzae TaxID=2932774 RepID=A0A9X1X6I9_9SPHI|nr:Wzz/FepE/Etk N-terminal domain-containing protein [Mucilaginibacter straminoryzae]MCJ8211823.1 Wzz/FepE/Etk N-terminal domain-containing protein [Mucilaginibacter straminoryzae]
MEFGNYFKLILKHKYILILVVIVAVIVTYFFVRNQPDSYTSQAQIATGIVDQTQQSLSQSVMQDSKVTQEFSNLLQLLRSKKLLDQVSYQLMIHDLTSKQPYRTPSKLLQSLGASARKHALDVYKDLYSKRQALSLFDHDQLGLYRLLVSMRYDDQSLLRTLVTYRSENSDFIIIEFNSDNPQLTATSCNTLAKELIDYYNFLLKENQRKAVNFLSDLLKAKQDSMAKRMQELKQYKIQNHVFNLNEQARALYGEITDVETRLEEAKKNSISYDAAIRNIDNQFNPSDRRYIESAMVKVNQDIINTRSQLDELNDKYVQSGFNESYRPKMDSLKHLLTTRINQSSDKYIISPLANKQNLIQQKLTLQVQYDLSKSSISSLQNQLVSLNTRLRALVPHEAVVQADENAITVANQEYLEILQKYNQTSLETNFTAHLKLVQIAMPGLAQPSKKMLLVILSGIIAFVFCLAVFFVLFLLDRTIKTPRELANKTRVSVIGYLNTLQSATIDLNRVWHTREVEGEVRLFKDLMQSIRFEVDNELKGSKILLVNSMKKGEGKTYLTLNLAYAHAGVGKKVLVIDGNFVNPGITELVKPTLFLEDLLSGVKNAGDFHTASQITYVGNKAVTGSLLELAPEELIKQKLEELRNLFDLILIEAPALDQLNKSKEWTLFAEKILTVYEAGQTFEAHQQVNVEYLRSFGDKFMGWIVDMVAKEHLANAAKG